MKLFYDNQYHIITDFRKRSQNWKKILQAYSFFLLYHHQALFVNNQSREKFWL